MNKKSGGTLTLNNAMFVLEVKKVKMTKNGLRHAAKRDGFKSNIRGENREKYLLDCDKFIEWLKKLDRFVPAGFVQVSSFARKKGISTSYVYDIIRKHKITPKIFGGGRGKFYINAKQVEKLLEMKKRNNNNKNNNSLKKRLRLSYKTRYDGYEDFLSSVV